MSLTATALAGKVALVTGSSRGIGRAIALALARYGADVVVNYRQQRKAAAEVVAEIDALGRRALAVPADVSRSAEAADLVKTTVAELGRLDILVNNAGITRDTLLLRMREEDWEAVLAVNLTGAFNVTRPAVRTMMRQRSGRIINISSVSGLMGQVGQANYAASKAGLIGFSKSLARELGSRGITSNAVVPGFIKTDMTAALDFEEEQLARALSHIPLGRFGEPEDVAEVVAFLASDGAAYITGAVVPVDGGLSM